MPGYFDEKLIDLLPPLYQERDTNGDLRSFLEVPAAALDELKSLIDCLPDIWNVDACDPRFLPVLAAIVGCCFDPTRDPDAQRRDIREAVERYRCKGTIPAIRRDLINVGWQGEIDETFRTALRLNKRSIVNHARLPGLIHSLGVYRVECRNLVSGLRDALRENHPAGVRVFFLQWLLSRESMNNNVFAALRRTVALHSTGRIHDVFVIGRRLLNSDYRLTKKQTTWSYWRIVNQVTATQGFERAGVLVSRWHGRMPGHKLNGFALNAERLIDVELSERRLVLTCEVEVDKPGISPVVFRLVREHLNRSKLARSTRSFRFVFRQKDFTSDAQASFDMATNLYRVTQWPGG